MAAQKQGDQLERTFSSYVRIQDVVLKTYLGRWTIGRSGERGSGISVLPARYDDDDDDDTYIYIYIYIYIRGSLDKFSDFFVWVLLLIVNTWNSSPLRGNLLWLQCTRYTVPTTSRRPHGSPLVLACQWPSSELLSSSQLSQKLMVDSCKILQKQSEALYTCLWHFSKFKTEFYCMSFF